MALLCASILFLFVSSGFVTSASSLPEAQKLWRSWQDPIEPSLAQRQLNITSVIGKAVSMPCRVRNLEDKTVSWIRGRDLTVLAVDETTYTSDQRFSVKHEIDSENWLLHLQGVSKEDEGVYDCQVNTYPKMSTKVYLKVVSKEVESFFFDRPISDTDVTSSMGGAWRELSEDPVQSGTQVSDSFGVNLMIRGKPWIRIQIGKTLQLTCEARRSRSHLTHLLSKATEVKIIGWTLDDVPVEILFPEWKVNVQETWTSSGIESELRLNSVTSADAGKISCVAPQATPATIDFDVNEQNSPKQHYLGLSNTKLKHEHHLYSHPMTSAVSGASVKGSNSKFAILCAAVMVFFTLTNIAVCFHYLRKT